jgi:hypothetical protein
MRGITRAGHPAAGTLLLGAFLGFTAIAGACSSTSNAATERPRTPARLQIESPAPNARTNRDVPVTLGLEHARLVVPLEGAEVRPDRGHLHVSLDGRIVAMPSSLHITVPALAPGPHTITVEFVASDHQPFRNRVVAAVTFVVE